MIYKGHEITKADDGLWKVVAKNDTQNVSRSFTTRDKARDWVTEMVTLDASIENQKSDVPRKVRVLGAAAAIALASVKTDNSVIDRAILEVLGEEKPKEKKPVPSIHGSYFEATPKPERLHYNGMTGDEVRANRKLRKTNEKLVRAKKKPSFVGFSSRRRPHL